MQAAELFVKLGVKGADQVKSTLVSVDKGVEKIASSSFAAKAAILATFYALQRMTAASGEVGQSLAAFGASTGQSTEMLQKWQYAGRQFGVTADEMQSTISGLGHSMTNMLMGNGAPEGFGILASKVGFDMSKARDSFYVMGKLQEFAKAVPPDVASNVLKSFGVSDKMFAFFAQNKMNIDKLKPSNMLGSGEIAALQKVDAAWARISMRLEGLRNKATAKFGLGAVDSLDHAISGVVRLTNALDSMFKKFPAFEGAIQAIGIALGLAFAPMTTLITGLTWILGEWDKKEKNQPSIFGEGDKEKVPEWMKLGDNFMQWATGDHPDLSKGISNFLVNGFSGKQLATEPSGSRRPMLPSERAPVINWNQANHIHTDTKKPQDHAKIISNETKKAAAQMGAMVQKN